MTRKGYKLITIDLEVLEKLKNRCPDLSPNNSMRKILRLPLHLPRGRHKPKSTELPNERNSVDKLQVEG